MRRSLFRADPVLTAKAVRVTPAHQQTAFPVAKYAGEPLLSPVRRVFEAAYLLPSEMQHDATVRSRATSVPALPHQRTPYAVGTESVPDTNLDIGC